MTVPDPLNPDKARKGILPLGRNTGIWAKCFEFRCLKSVKWKSYGEIEHREQRRPSERARKLGSQFRGHKALENGERHRSLHRRDGVLLQLDGA